MVQNQGPGAESPEKSKHEEKTRETRRCKGAKYDEMQVKEESGLRTSAFPFLVELPNNMMLGSRRKSARILASSASRTPRYQTCEEGTNCPYTKGYNTIQCLGRHLIHAPEEDDLPGDHDLPGGWCWMVWGGKGEVAFEHGEMPLGFWVRVRVEYRVKLCDMAS